MILFIPSDSRLITVIKVKPKPVLETALKRQADLCGIKDSLAYVVRPRRAGSQKRKKERKTKKRKE